MIGAEDDRDLRLMAVASRNAITHTSAGRGMLMAPGSGHDEAIAAMTTAAARGGDARTAERDAAYYFGLALGLRLGMRWVKPTLAAFAAVVVLAVLLRVRGVL